MAQKAHLKDFTSRSFFPFCGESFIPHRVLSHWHTRSGRNICFSLRESITAPFRLLSVLIFLCSLGWRNNITANTDGACLVTPHKFANQDYANVKPTVFVFKPFPKMSRKRSQRCKQIKTSYGNLHMLQLTSEWCTWFQIPLKLRGSNAWLFCQAAHAVYRSCRITAQGWRTMCGLSMPKKLITLGYSPTSYQISSFRQGTKDFCIYWLHIFK